MKRIILFIIILIFSYKNTISQNIWITKSDFLGGDRFNAISFTIGNKAYIGLGNNYTKSFQDIWEYDASNDSWSQKSIFPAGPRCCAVAFSIGNKGYVGTGLNDSGIYVNDFWQYDTLNNSWAEKASIGNFGRVNAVGFSIGNYGFIGTGEKDTISDFYLDDFWKYNPDSDTWIKMADFLGSPRSNAVGFSIKGNGYISTGEDESNLSANNELWEYETLLDTWIPRMSLPAQSRRGAVGFSSDTFGFLGTGYYSQFSQMLNDFWKYNPDSDSWKKESNFLGSARTEAIGFAVNGNQFICLGSSLGDSSHSDLWEYSQDTTDNITVRDFSSKINIYPNPSVGYIIVKGFNYCGMEAKVSIYDYNGMKKIEIIREISPLLQINLSDLKVGIYLMEIELNNLRCIKKIVIV